MIIKNLKNLRKNPIFSTTKIWNKKKEKERKILREDERKKIRTKKKKRIEIINI